MWVPPILLERATILGPQWSHHRPYVLCCPDASGQPTGG
jgi:hypothetical protein